MRPCHHTFFGLALTLTLAGMLSSTAAAQKDLLVRAKKVYLSPDKVLENSAILISNGRIAFVGDEIPAESARNARKLEFRGTLVAGFVNPHCYLGHGMNLRENIDAFTPELLAADAFDPFEKQVLKAARAGVTAVGLAPQSYNIFAGQAAVIHTGPLGRILEDASYLKMALVQQAFDQNRFPTSRMGAADMIRRTFKKAGSPLGATNIQLKVLKDVQTGSKKVAIHVETQGEIIAALDLAQELTLKPILVGVSEGHKCLDRLVEAKVSLVLTPLSFNSKKQRLELPATLEKRGVSFSFMAERHLDLRLSAALAVRHGCSRKKALQAVTTEPALQLDVADKTGSLFQGRYADFAIYSGDPLDLSSRLEAVFVAGKAVDMSDKESK